LPTSRHLGVCGATAYAVVERVEHPHVRVSNAVRYHPADVTAFIMRLRS
jgi:hypothetical protein